MILFGAMLAPCSRALAIAPASGTECDEAGAAAEKRYGIPPGLLRAIGMVESGRVIRNARSSPWPWTLDVTGRGAFYDTKEAARSSLAGVIARGISSVDVGCFQVNLAWHPDAFASLDEALDPIQNADYAARFLSTLHERIGSWSDAVARYHSATPDRGARYSEAVLSRWSGGFGAAHAPLSDPHVIHVASFLTTASTSLIAPGSSPPTRRPLPRVVTPG